MTDRAPHRAPDRAPGRAPVPVDPDQIEQLHRLLGTVEDWLLHACDAALDDLAGFLAGQAWSTAPAERLAAALIAELGEHTLLLRQTRHGAPRTRAAS
jgi:hypothetical protein